MVMILVTVTVTVTVGVRVKVRVEMPIGGPIEECLGDITIIRHRFIETR